MKINGIDHTTNSNLGGSCLYHRIINSLTPIGCPTIQVNADTIYLDIAPDPTDTGTVL